MTHISARKFKPGGRWVTFPTTSNLRKSFAGSAVVALMLAGCVQEPLQTESPDVAIQPVYTAAIARSELADLEKKVEKKSSQRASAPFVLQGLRSLLDGDYIKANEGLQRALKFDPRNSYLHTINALAHQLRGDNGDPEQYEQALVGYELAARMDPGAANIPYFMGVLKFRQQRFLEAREQFARAVLLDPQNVEYLTGLAAASYYIGELDVAYAVASKAKSLAPKNPNVLRTSGIIYAAVGDFDDAEDSKNALTGISNTRKQFVSRRIDDWARYYANNKLMNDPEIVELLAQNLDAFGVPKGGMFDPEGGNNEDPTLPTNTDPSDSSQGIIPPPGEDPTPIPASAAPSSSTTPPATSSPQTVAPVRTNTVPTSTTTSTTTPAATPAAALPEAKPKIKIPNMALVDVAIIRTEEIYRSSKGVNLLNGLNIFFSGNQFAQFKTPGGIGRVRTALTANDTLTLQLGTAGAGLTYSLNIFNDNYDRNEVIARPTILVEDQKKSSFFSGGTLHIVIEGGVAGSGAIQPINTGVKLEVTPNFRDEDTLEMSVFAERTFLEAALSQVSDTITGTSFATTSKTTISANLTLRYGETMVLSGLSDQEKEKLDDKTPGLGDLPLIQYLFRNQTKTSAKKTVLILLTPRKATLNYNDQAEPLPEPENTDNENIEKLEKSANWMRPAPHLQSLVRHLSKYDYFNHFRTGDMQLENWAGEGTVLDAIKRTLEYLYIYYDFEKNEEPELK